MSALTATSDPYDVSITRLAIVLLRTRYHIARLGLLAAAVVVIVGLLGSRKWSSTATFVPQARRAAGGNLQGLAAQFGISAPTGEAAQQSPAFYADLVTSREILSDVATRSYRTVDDSIPRALADVWKIKNVDPARRHADTIRRLAESIDASVTQKTGVVNLSVRTVDPLLSRRIADAIIEGLNRFNMQIRQSQASAERRFSEQRLSEVRADLRSAEDDLQVFLQRNREYQGSADLRFRQDRLARVVTMQQQIYSSMAQAYEQAKLEEVRDTPLLTVVVRPDRPAYPDTRGLIKKAFLAFIVTALAVAVIAYLRDTPVSGQHDADERVRVGEEFWREVRRPWVMLRRFLTGHATP